jgi:hypothetical protein
MKRRSKIVSLRLSDEEYDSLKNATASSSLSRRRNAPRNLSLQRIFLFPTAIGILTSLADGMLMVVRCGKTSCGALEKACRYLDRTQLIGMVFNDVKPMMFNTQYDHRYYHSRNYYPYSAQKVTRRPKTYLE